MTEPWQHTKRVPLGLQNLGNTCYLNSVLQALISCELFTTAINSEELSYRLGYDLQQQQQQLQHHHGHGPGNGHENSYDCGSHQAATCSLCIIQTYALMFQYHQQSDTDLDAVDALYSHSSSDGVYRRRTDVSSDKVLAPLALVEILSQLSSTFHPGIQQDAHEFFRLLLSSLESASHIHGHSRHGLRSTLAGAISSHSHDDSNISPVSRLFHGSLANMIECSVCRKVSVKVDPFEGLDVGVAKASALSVALHDFFDVEVLQNDNAYACDRCCRKTTAWKTLRLVSHLLPTVLTIQLKRFNANFSKIQHHIQFPVVLDMKTYFTSQQQPSLQKAAQNQSTSSVYELAAVIVHLGQSMDSGHYVSYVRRESRWFRADDAIITECGIDEVCQQQAYILFYQRQDQLSSRSSARSSASLTTVTASGSTLSSLAVRPSFDSLSDHKRKLQRQHPLQLQQQWLSSSRADHNGSAVSKHVVVSRDTDVTDLYSIYNAYHDQDRSSSKTYGYSDRLSRDDDDDGNVDVSTEEADCMPFKRRRLSFANDAHIPPVDDDHYDHASKKTIKSSYVQSMKRMLEQLLGQSKHVNRQDAYTTDRDIPSLSSSTIESPSHIQAPRRRKPTTASVLMPLPSTAAASAAAGGDVQVASAAATTSTVSRALSSALKYSTSTLYHILFETFDDDSVQ